MSNTINFIAGYIRPYAFRIMIAFLVIVFVIIGYYGYRQVYKQVTDLKPYTNVANEASGNETVIITFYHVDWCPHCKTATPEWQAFKEKYNKKQVNGYTVSCIDIDCTDSEDKTIAAVLDKNEITSFPTVKAVLPGLNGKEKTISFESKTNQKNLEKFVNSITSNNV